MMRRGHPGMPAPPLPPPPGPVSNVTNSSDFASKDSRVFVGNLNTFVLAKEDVDGIFCHYGMVTGISMHKGYAFVQFSHPGEARRAVAFEQGQMYAGQPLDLNIVSEPKQRAPQKRAAGGPPSYESRNRRAPVQQSPTVPPVAKRPRQDNPSLQRSNLVTLANSGRAQTMNRPRPNPVSATSRVAAAAVKRANATVTKSVTPVARGSSSVNSVQSTTDVLICGVCKMQFTSLHSLAQHKKIPCRLKISCQCQTNPPKLPDIKEPLELECASCDGRFDTAWALIQHSQDEHDLSIFKTKDGTSKSNSSAGTPNAKASGKGETGSVDKNGNDGEEKKEGEKTTPNKK